MSNNYTLELLEKHLESKIDKADSFLHEYRILEAEIINLKSNIQHIKDKMVNE